MRKRSRLIASSPEMALSGEGNPELNLEENSLLKNSQIMRVNTNTGTKRKIDSVSDTLDNKRNVTSFETVYYDESVCENNEKYFVLLDSVEKNEDTFCRLNAIKLFKALEKYNLKEGLIRINKIGFRRAKVSFKSAKDANLVMKKSKELETEFLRPFIPLSFVYKFGVIRDIPLNISDQEIKDNICSDIPIHSITRLTRFISSNNSRTNSTSVKIAFKRSSIPDSVSLFYYETKVSYFIPRPKQCLKCGRMGHLDKFCKSTKSRCLRCGKDGKNCDPPCTKSSMYLLCGAKGHSCLDSKDVCNKKQEHEQINKIMTIGNLSFNEVRETYTTSNSFEVLTDKDYEINFPELPKNKNKTKNNQDEINKTLRKHHTYNKVVYQKQYKIPDQKPLIRGEALDIPSQSIFSIPFEKVSDFEKTISFYLSKFIEMVENIENKELKETLMKCKNNFNYAALLIDKAEIDSAQSIEND